jgi:hypothetical protein
MRSLARYAWLGLSLLVAGCGATQGAAPVAVTSPPAHVAGAPRSAFTAEPSPACLSPETRAAVERCDQAAEHRTRLCWTISNAGESAGAGTEAFG